MIEESTLAVRLKHNRDIVTYRPQLEYAERKIVESLKEASGRLRDIQEKELWRYADGVEYASMDDYCQKRWGFGVRRRQQIMHSEEVRLMLADAVETPEAKAFLDTAKEGQVRALEAVPVYERPKLLDEIVQTNPNPTGAQILEIGAGKGLVTASKLKPRTRHPRAKEKVICPDCGKAFEVK